MLGQGSAQVLPWGLLGGWGVGGGHSFLPSVW